VKIQSAVSVEPDAFSGSKIGTIIVTGNVDLKYGALNNVESLKQIHFTSNFPSKDTDFCDELGNLQPIFSTEDVKAVAEGWACSLPIFKGDASGAVTTAKSFLLSEVSSAVTITSPESKPSTIKGNLPSGYIISLKGGVSLEDDDALGKGSGIRSIGELNLNKKTLSFTVEVPYEPLIPIDLSSGSIAAADSKVDITVGGSVAHLSGDELASLHVRHLVTGFADDAACKAVSNIAKLNQPELTTEVEFTLECEEQTGTAVGLNAAGFDLILVGTKKQQDNGGTSPPGAAPGGGSGDDDKGLSAGAVAGIVIGVAVVVGLATGLIVYFVMSRKRKVSEEKDGST
jgi:hypothetical protein